MLQIARDGASLPLRAISVMPDPTFAEQMVAKYQTLLLSAAGMRSINVDGQVVSVSDLETKWNFWKAEVAKESGSKPRLSVIKMGGV